MLLKILNKLLPKTKPSKTFSWKTVGNERKKVVVEWRPLVQSKVIKEKITDVKKNIRETQSSIELMNQKLIELTFTYDDLEDVIFLTESHEIKEEQHSFL